jgi:hypothetical protein
MPSEAQDKTKDNPPCFWCGSPLPDDKDCAVCMGASKKEASHEMPSSVGL